MDHRRTTSPLALTALLTALTLLPACGGSDRPAVDTWSARWDEAVASIPTMAQLGSPPDKELCESVLTYLRETRNDLLPTPDRAIDDVVTLWIRIAEDAFFECPPRGTEIPDFAYAYGELARLQAEVEAVLELDR